MNKNKFKINKKILAKNENGWHTEFYGKTQAEAEHYLHHANITRTEQMKVIYLGAYEAYHPNFDVIYQDINGKRDMGGDMLEVDLKPYDMVIATPPCNYWSIARGNRCSQYSMDTKHLLPEIIKRLAKENKPFVVENVVSKKRFREEGIFDVATKANCFIYNIGRHTYFTNIKLADEEVNLLESQNRQDFRYGGKVIKYPDMKNKKHQGGFNVHLVIDYFLKKGLASWQVKH